MFVTKELRTIFHVDDDQALLDLTQLSLRASGRFEIQCFESAAQALYRLPLGVPNLVLLDLVMPRMDGLMFLKYLRQTELATGIPVILLTGMPGKARRETLSGMGVIGVIAKPFDPMNLGGRIEAIWAEYALRRPI